MFRVPASRFSRIALEVKHQSPRRWLVRRALHVGMRHGSARPARRFPAERNLASAGSRKETQGKRCARIAAALFSAAG